MRNGNSTTFSISIFQSNSSYRTYEEWKQIVTNSAWVWKIVLTVPMRNGNKIWTQTMDSRLKFLPYLWGMETWSSWPKKQTRRLRSYRTYEEWKLICLIKRLIGCYGFLPYLWGMETINPFQRMWCKNEFLPYLWGMETTPWSIRKVWALKFLPYLWGMETN